MSDNRATVSFVAWIGAGVVAGAVAIVVALSSAGGGHGSYGLAAVLFPYTMISTRFFGSITPPFMVLAVIQFPVYGAVIAWAGDRGGKWKVLAAIAAVHAVAAILAGYGRGAGFYP